MMPIKKSQAIWLCMWRHLVAKFLTNANNLLQYQSEVSVKSRVCWIRTKWNISSNFSDLSIMELHVAEPAWLRDFPRKETECGLVWHTNWMMFAIVLKAGISFQEQWMLHTKSYLYPDGVPAAVLRISANVSFQGSNERPRRPGSSQSSCGKKSRDRGEPLPPTLDQRQTQN